MFKNKNNITFRIKKPERYFTYIFCNFAKFFFIWLFIFLIVLFAIDQTENVADYGIYKNLFFSFIRSLVLLNNNINIVCIVSCIFFFIWIARNFNIYVLKSFGLASKQILRPVFIFLIILCFFRIFCLQPLCIKLENQRKILESREEKIFLKEGTDFMVFDGDDIENYMIISGKYKSNNDNGLIFNDAVVLKYKNKELEICYSAREALLRDNNILLKDVNITNVGNKKSWLETANNVYVKTNITIKLIIKQINNTEKVKKTFLLNLYDHLGFLKGKNNNYNNDIRKNSITYIVNEIISSLNIILCCFLSFFLCVKSARDASILKSSLKCFIVYFAILRIFHSLEKIIVYSVYVPVYIISIAVLLCIFTYYLILDKDCGHYYYNSIKKDIIIFVRKCLCFMKEKLSHLRY